MEHIPFFGIAILVFYIFMRWLNIVESDKQRKFELEKLKIEKSQRFIAEPLAVSLLKEIKENKIEMSDDNKDILVNNLNIMIINFESNQPNYEQLKEARSKLNDLLKTGNLVTDLAIKIEQLLNVFQ